MQGEWTKLENERWLLQQCSDPEFYFNLKEHTDLCAVVVANANSNAYLNALQTVAASAHMCGTSTCMVRAKFEHYSNFLSGKKLRKRKLILVHRTWYTPWYNVLDGNSWD